MDQGAPRWWQEEPLLASAAETRDLVKGLGHKGPKPSAAAVGVLRVDTPRWRSLPAATDSPRTRRLLVRLGFQFDLTEEGHAAGAHFVRALCRAHIEAEVPGEHEPLVYDIEPRSVNGGGRRGVRVAFAPKLSLAGVELSLAEASAEADLGVVVPVIQGYPGEDERHPYWRLHGEAAAGTRHLWMLVEAPDPGRVRIKAQGEGDVRVPFWKPIRVGPKQRAWGDRPSLVIGPSG